MPIVYLILGKNIKACNARYATCSLRVLRDVCEIAIKLKLESAIQWHTPPLLQVLVLLLAFSYAYFTYIIKLKLESATQWHTPPLLQAWSRTESKSCLPDILSVWLDSIAMSEPLESELAGVTLESDALPQEDFPPGDLRRRPEVPGHLGQAAAVPTYGLLQVDNEDPLFNSDFETGGGETLQTLAPSGPQSAPTATAVGVVGIHLQHIVPIWK
jgi:hypothetical protein